MLVLRFIFGINDLLSLLFGVLISLVWFRSRITRRVWIDLKENNKVLISHEEAEVLLPIFDQEENYLIDINGKKSFVFEIIPPDLDHYETHRVQSFFHELAFALNSFDSKYWYRLDARADKYFVNTDNPDFNLPAFKFLKVSEPLNEMFGDAGLFSNLIRSSSYIEYNSKVVRYIPLVELPNDIPCHDYLKSIHPHFTLVFRRTSSSENIKNIDVKRSRLFSTRKAQVNYKEEEAYSQIETLKRSLEVGDEKLWKVAIYFRIEGYSHESVSLETEALTRRLQSLGIESYLSDISLKDVFLETFWGCEPKLNSTTLKTLKTTTLLSYLIPSHSDFLAPNGLELFSLDGRTIYFKLDDQRFENRNMLVFGPSGSGKSFFTCGLVSHHYERGAEIFVVDRLSSFKKTCLYYGGRYEDQQLNFLFSDDLTYLSAFIESLVDAEIRTNSLSGEIYSRVKEAVLSGQNSSHKKFFSFLSKGLPVLKNYFLKFEDFVTDSREETVSQFNVLEIDQIPKEYQSTFLFAFCEKFFKSSGEKYFVVEEIHSYVSSPLASNYIDQFWRKIRKMNGGCIGITHSFDEVNNADNKLLANLRNSTDIVVVFAHKTPPSENLLNGKDRSNYDKIIEFRSGESLNLQYDAQDRDFSALLILAPPHISKPCLYRVLDPVLKVRQSTTPEETRRFENWYRSNSMAFINDGEVDHEQLMKAYSRIRYE